jgi:hypothetical protein
MSGPSATPQTYPYRNEPIWSRLERVIARKIFDAALKRELHQVMQETKQKASQLKEARDLWTLERYLTDRRKDIDRKYDFRASRLTRVFGTLLYDGRVTEEELHGLQEDKLEAIRSCAEMLSEDAA